MAEKKESKKEKIPETWEERTEACWNDFFAETDYQKYKPYSNGFIGVGILKTQEDHGKGKRVNQIVFTWYLTFDSVPDSYNRVAVTLDEAKDVFKNLDKVLKEVESRKK